MKKAISLVLAAATCLTICAINAGMAFGASSKVTLNRDQKYSYSGWVRGRQAAFWGESYNSSAHSVYFQPQYQIPGDTVNNDKYYTVNPGSALPRKTTANMNNSNTNWRLQLDVRLWLKNCSAYGYIEA